MKKKRTKMRKKGNRTEINIDYKKKKKEEDDRRRDAYLCI